MTKKEFNINGEKLLLRAWNFKEDRTSSEQLLDLVFQKDLSQMGLAITSIFQEYEKMVPIMKVLSLIDSGFKHAFDGFVIENSKKQIIAFLNVSYSTNNQYEISMVATHPDYRRKGLGKMLIDEAINHVKNLNARICYLEVIDHNEPAYELYKKQGFIHYESVIRLKLTLKKQTQNPLDKIHIPNDYSLRGYKYSKKINESCYQLDLLTTPLLTQKFFPVQRKKYHKPFFILVIRPLVSLFIPKPPTYAIYYKTGNLVAKLTLFMSKKKDHPHSIDILMDPAHSQQLATALVSFAINNIVETKGSNVAIIEFRPSETHLLDVCRNLNFEELEHMHKLGIKF